MFTKLRANPYFGSVLTALAWIPVAIFTVDHGFSYAKINGRSMQPTFNPDSNLLKRDTVFLNKWTATRNNFKRGEVVTLISPTDPKQMITKRILALPGDTIKPLRNKEEKSIPIPAGHCWVEGDEAFHSIDSNSFGVVPIGLIKAKVTYILWPFSRFGPVRVRPVNPDRVKTEVFVPGKVDDH
ncbi:LexA/Signal peptidase [Backusella circina FSU 941]|nr:LexA/Signal peptidase [Backusella circina FSU 941]